MKTKLLLFIFLAFFSAYSQSSTIPSYVPKDKLLAYFPFNGDTNDASGSGSNAITKDVTLTTDRFGIANTAYSFNGISSNIEANIIDYPLKGGSRTLTGWFKATDIITSKELDFCLLSFGNASDPDYWFKISFNKKGYLDIQFDSKTFQSKENYFNNQWTFFAMVFDEDTNTFSLYINNVLKLSGTAELYTRGFDTLFRIGKNKSNNYFEGTIDDIGIWNSVLTQDEITNLYNAKNKKPYYTLIPDINFEKKLISLGIDFGIPDGEVLTENLKLIGSLDLSSSSIINLAGIQDFTSLSNLNISENQLQELDLTANKQLQVLNCANNGEMTFMNIQNGNNNLLTTVNFKNNPKLSCIQVDNVSYSNTNWSNHKDTATNFSLDCNPTTSIPDRNFEKRLISLGIDSGIPDGKILSSKISSLTKLDISYSSITDLTGIQDFTSLENLTCTNNKLTNLDLSKNIALTNLNCNSNQLKTLNISKNILLTNLVCHSNKLTNLDITELTTLKDLYCNSNLLTNLNVSKNIAITNLVCYYNKLTSLDVSSNIAITNLDCNSNQITSLDVSKNPALKSFNFSYNQLISLNLKNGNNINFNINNYLVKNPQLRCIQVDDVTYSNANWSAYKDNSARFSTDCSPIFVIIPDQNFEQKLIDLGIDTDGLNGKITSSDISSITDLDLSNSNIKDLTGIEIFTALKNLNCSNNQLTSLDLSKNNKLEILYITGNPLVYLNLRNGNNKNLIIASGTGKKTINTPVTTFLGLTSLGCIKVDDAAYSNANWSKIKETTTTYSETCTLGVEDSIFDKVTVYPNPTKGELHINNAFLDKATVYNSLGQLVKTFTLNSSNTNNTINLSGLAKGVYYVYLINQDSASAKKIIVE